ncbi:MAG: hypothetical protein ABIT96_11130 [Ferruginibacter sp.]
MKLRLKGNSLRLRLTKMDVQKLADTGEVVEVISFPGNNILTYRLGTDEKRECLEVRFENNIINVKIPANFARDWPDNQIVGINNSQANEGKEIYILIEKDFVCLDETAEDQSDNFANPKLTTEDGGS